MIESEDLVVIKRYEKAVDAYLAQSFLNEYGVEAFVHDEHIGRQAHFSMGMAGGVKLRVRESEKSKAMDLLKSVDDANLSLVDNELYEGRECSRCNSVKTELIQVGMNSRWSSLLLGILMLLPLANKNTESWMCHSCGHKWVENSGSKLKSCFKIWAILLVLLFVGIRIYLSFFTK